MANREGIDLDAAFQRMMEKVTARDESRWTKKQS
jgi:NTP pyrophosphatase (non-canonical NTP hydrolase)